MNTPYVRKYTKDGEHENPIIDRYLSEFPNRKERRKKALRFRGNKKGISLTVVKNEKYKRFATLIQTMLTHKGKPIEQTVENNHIKRKVVNHYL